MIPVQSAGGGGPVKKSPVEEGQIIGTEFVRGDYSAFGYGTITYIDKNKKELLAYGHSASDEGNVKLTTFWWLCPFYSTESSPFQ